MMIRFICVICLIGFVCPAVTQDDVPRVEPRTWTDESGKFSVQAKFVKLSGSIVELEKSDGSRVKLELSRLSENDRSWIQKALSSPSGKPLTLGQLKSREQTLLFATRIAEAYREYLKQSDLSGTDRDLAERRLKEIEPEASRDAIFVNGKFKLRIELTDLASKSTSMIEEAMKEIHDLDKKETVKAFNEASRMDPVSCRADFLLALGYAMGIRNYEYAEKHFQECESRLRKFEELAHKNSKQARLAVLNNLAIVQVRLGYLDRAGATWERAIEVEGNLPQPVLDNFVHQILFVNAAEHSKGALYFDNPTPALIRRYRKLSSQINLNENSLKGHHQHGWQYLALDLSDKMPELDKLKLGMTDEACLMCNGTSFAICQGCGGDGKVLGKRMNSRVLATGQTQYFEESIVERCGKCRGDGRFDCPACNSGIEQLPRR